MRKLLQGLVFPVMVLFFPLSAHAQMWNGTDTLYGNEWINYSQTYFKIPVAQDGIYRIPGNILPAGVEASRLRLYHLGVEVPLYATTSGLPAASDYLEFFGLRHRSELDQYLYANPDLHFHPDYSLFNDTAAYFLTWSDDPSGLRYQEVANDLNSLPPKEEYFLAQVSTTYTTEAIKKSTKFGTADLQDSHFADAEGFCTGFSGPLVRNLSVALPGIYTAGSANAEATVRFACRDGGHKQVVRVNGTTFVTDEFFGFAGRKHSFSVPVNLLTASTTVQFEGQFDANDKQAVSNIEFRYPRVFDFDNQNLFRFDVEASAGVRYLEISNFNATTDPILYDLTNGIRIQATLDNGLVRIALPPSASNRQLMLVNPETGFTGVSVLEPLTFTDFEPANASLVMLYQQALAEGPVNWVAEYASYRQSAPGNAHATLAAEIQQVYDQFGYGVDRHSLALRNFIHYLHREWDDLNYVLLIGKGREYRQIRTAAQLAAAEGINFFLPTFGFPGADNLLGSDNFTGTPIIPIGRIPATSPDDVRIYLEKVQAFEAAPLNTPQTAAGKAWMKRIMHLGGGGEIGEQTIIRNSLLGMEAIIENNQFGGQVTSFYKTSTDPIEVSQSAALKETINEGIAILTFFGHSSPNIFDFNFDDPGTYDNEGKYPLMFSMGCFSGQCHGDVSSIGERFVLAEDRGAIGFVASTGYGFISALDRFGDEYYHRLGTDLYGAGVGDVFVEAIRLLDGGAFVGETELAQQTTFQGDPSLRLYPFDGPDYLPDGSSATLEPELLSLQVDSFNLSVDIRNLGYHIPDTSFLVEIEQLLPNGERISLLQEEVAGPAFLEKAVFRLPLLGEEAVGLNRFFLKVDAAEAIAELPLGAESNNELIGADDQPGIPVLVVSNDLAPVFPPEFAIVNETPVTLSASTGNAFSPDQTYWIEVDTSSRFNSPLRWRDSKKQAGGTLQWTPPVPWTPNRVYYWRVSPDSVETGSYRWRSSSFVYNPALGDGWNQSHLNQFERNTFFNMEMDSLTGELDFVENVIDFKVRNCILSSPSRIPRYYRGNLSVVSYSGGAMTSAVPAGVMIGVIDTLNAQPWTNDGSGQYGDDFLSPNLPAFLFKTDNASQRAEVVNFLQNTIPDGYYVVFFTLQKDAAADFKPQEWDADTLVNGTGIFQALAQQGAVEAQQLAQTGSRPYSLFFRKNTPAYPLEEKVGELFDFTEVNGFVEGDWFTGSMTSAPVGPARSWERLQWEMSAFDAATDTVSLDLYGIRPDGTDSLLAVSIAAADTSLAGLSAEAFPQMKLYFAATDPTFKSSPQIPYWRVLYEGLPEAALAPNLYLSFEDTLQQGQPLEMSLAIGNLSDYGMDSLLVRYTLVDALNQQTIIDRRYAPLPEQDTLHARLQWPTDTMLGRYQLLIEANPDDDQPELTRTNNFGLLAFTIVKDMRNPLLDVTFDGQAILDGDIVSAQPLIYIGLKDENPYLPVTDTSAFRLLLGMPDGQTRRIYFSDPAVQFVPAQTGKPNKAGVEWRPEFGQDGVYELFVEAVDASGNPSGNLNLVIDQSEYGYDYRISFRVIQKPMLSSVLNYPNPFSNSTRFVYTLTGSEPPVFFKIQVMTVSGRVVRELTQVDLGPLRIGTHQTDYAWDGTDMYGDPLATGIYLYRITARQADGREYDLFQTGADGFIDKGFGKMVLIR